MRKCSGREGEEEGIICLIISFHKKIVVDNFQGYLKVLKDKH